MKKRILELREIMISKLEPERYEHSLSVAYTSMALAMRYGYDLEKAELAGLLHDCAKHYDTSIIIEKCHKQGISLTDDELKATSVLHAKYGAWLAENRYQITDNDVVGAIRWHTTGKPMMSLSEKILYVADYIEPRRYKASNLPEIRKMAFINLELSIYHIMNDTLLYLKNKGLFIDSMTIKAHEYYKTLQDKI